MQRPLDLRNRLPNDELFKYRDQCTLTVRNSFEQQKHQTIQHFENPLGFSVDKFNGQPNQISPKPNKKYAFHKGAATEASTDSVYSNDWDYRDCSAQA